MHKAKDMRRTGIQWVFATVLTALVWFASAAAWAGYNQPGYNLQTVQSGQGLANTAVSFDINGLWGVSGRDIPVTTWFTVPSCQDVSFSRLYLDVWGGTRNYTCTVTASLNGAALGTVSMGTTADANPTFNAAQTCVYGTGSGMWQIAYSGIAPLLYKNGTPNQFVFTVSDPLNQFDGRTTSASLMTVYSDPSVNQTLDYYLAEADGTMRRVPGTNGSPTQRMLTMAGLNLSDVVGATYTAGFTHGTTGENDQIFFNGTPLGGPENDIALGSALDYGPSLTSFDVGSLLSPTSLIRYTVDASDVGSSGESYVRANVGLLQVMHPVPEPGTLALMASGLGAVWFMRRKRLWNRCRKKQPAQTADAPGQTTVSAEPWEAGHGIDAAKTTEFCRGRRVSGRSKSSNRHSQER